MARDYRYFPPYPPLYYGRGVVDQLMDDLRMYGNAFAMREPHGQDWPATKEEESRMKPIDFSKPLRTTTVGYSVEVIKEGVTLVQWYTSDGRRMRAAVDEKGELQPTGDWTNSSFRVENVPEPKREYLHLYQVVRRGEWRIDVGGKGQLFTKEEAENESRNWARHAGAKNTVVVKVPV